MEQTRSLATLHHVIQAAFGWSDIEQHEFEIDGLVYANAEFALGELEGAILDEHTYRINEVTRTEQVFTYRYDFDSNWSHRILVEAIVPADDLLGYAIVLAGSRASPPESLDGPEGYRLFRRVMARDPLSYQAHAYRVLAGDDYDPERYDRQAANAALQRLERNHWIDD